MARRAVDPTLQSPWRRRFVVLATVLFPLLVVGGALAPQVISVMIDESQLPGTEEETDEAKSLDFSRPLPGTPPLPLTRDFDTGFRPGLLDLQQLFTRTRRRNDPMSRQFSSLLSFPRNHGDVIVMDDVDRLIRDVVFKDPLLVGAVTGDYGPVEPDLLALGNPRPAGDGLNFDDPLATGEGPVDVTVAFLPEPSSFMLTAAGLLFLALRNRHRELRR